MEPRPLVATFHVEGMTCQSCANTIQGALSKLSGVKGFEVSHTKNSATVTYDANVTNPENICACIEDVGFSARRTDLRQAGDKREPKLQVAVFQAEDSPGHGSSNILHAQLERVLGVSGVTSLHCSYGPSILVVEFDPVVSCVENIQNEVNMTHLEWSSTLLSVKGMTCSSCVRNIEAHVGQLPGVKGVKVSLEEESARFVYDGAVLTAASLAEAIDDMGFECKVITSNEINGGVPDVAFREAERILATIPEREIVSGNPTDTDAKLGNFDDTEKCLLRVTGMTCASCVSAIERQLISVKGVQFALVALLPQKAEVKYNPSLVQPAQLVDLINSIGFGASIIDDHRSAHGEAEFLIRGMTCSSCVHAIESNVSKIPGVVSASVSLATQRGRFTFDADRTGPREILDRIHALGFQACPFTDHRMDASYLSQKEEVKKWRNSFLFSLVFGVPSMILMMYYMAQRMITKRHNQCCMLPGLSSENFFLLLF